MSACFSARAIITCAWFFIVCTAVPVVGQETALPREEENARPWRYLLPSQKLVDSKLLKNEIRSKVNSVLRGRERLEDHQAVFDGYYQQYLFRMMTCYFPVGKGKDIDVHDGLGEQAKWREDLFKKHIKSAKNKQVHDHLVQLTFDFMSGIVRPARAGSKDFHPAVRYNAMLIVGELNSREAVKFGEKAPPDPLVGALAVLLEGLVTPGQIDAVRVASLIGILRHLELDQFRPNNRRLPDAAKERIFTAVLAIAAANMPPEGRSVAGNHWMRGRAVELLSVMNLKGTEDKVAVAVENILRDEESPLSLRCTAAKTLGRIPLPESVAHDPSATAARMGLLAVAACREEVVRLESMRKEQQEISQPGGIRPNRRRRNDIVIPGLPGRTPMSEEMPMEPEKDLHLELVRRQLMSRFHCVHVGLVGPYGEGGVAAVAKQDPHRTNVTGMVKAIEGLMEVCRESDLEELMKKLGRQGSALDDRVRTLAAQAATADPVEGPGAEDGPDSPEGPGAEEDLDVATSTGSELE